MNNKLSIIIPVYNVERYIEKCIKSIISKKIEKCEIILVDDGSTDRSGSICDEYAAKYKNISVIHQENMGLSEARNSGIRKSSGEYLMFIDGDDFLLDKFELESLLENLNDDIIQYKWIYYYEKKDKYVFFKEHKQYDGNVSDILLNKIADDAFSVSACDKVIKRSLIVDNDLYFKKGIYSEDLDWSLRVYLCATSLKDINEDVYVYRQQRENSITNKFGKKNIDDLYNIIKYWYKYNYKDEKYKKAYCNYLAYHYVILITIINKSNCDDNQKKEIMKMQSILEYSLNRKVKLCRNMFKIFGIKLGTKVLKCYIWLKNQGIVKL